jgi:hypothetical protein
MTSKHSFVVDDIVMEFFTERNKGERDDLLRIFKSLADNPYQKGEWLQKSKSDRTFQVKRFGKWVITFWLVRQFLNSGLSI